MKTSQTGVNFYKSTKKFVAKIRMGKDVIFLGGYSKEVDAQEILDIAIANQDEFKNSHPMFKMRVHQIYLKKCENEQISENQIDI